MSDALLISPHHDDAVLFSAFNTILLKPTVCTVFRSDRQRDEYGITHAQREHEDRAALYHLGVTSYIQLDHSDARPHWAQIHGELRRLILDHKIVLAPAAEKRRGQAQHDEIGTFVWKHFRHQRRVIRYLTYTWEGKSTWGQPVRYEPEWVPMKLRALACYESQMRTSSAPHFLRELTEYVA